MKTRISICALLLLAFEPAPAIADLLPGTPVSRSMLDENRLVLHDANIEIPPPPGEHWEWREMPAGDGRPRSFLCINVQSGQVVAVTPQDVRALLISDRFISNMWEGIDNAAKESNLVVAERYHRRISLPHTPAVLLHYTSARPDRATLHFFTYLVATGRVCLIQASSSSATLPGVLAAVASGVRPLRQMEPADIFPAVRTATSLWSYLIIGLMTLAIATERDRRRKRKGNPWSAVLLSLPIVYAAWMGLVYQTGIFEDMTRAQVQQASGYMAGTPMLLALVCATPWLIRRHQIRRSVPTEAPAPPNQRL